MGLSVGTPVRRAAVALGWLRCCLSPPDSSQGRNAFARGSGAALNPADRSADFGRLEGVMTRRSDRLAVTCHALIHPVDKAVKRAMGWVLAPYHASRDCRVR